MGELTDKMKGKTEEVAGAATEDRELEARGKTEQLKGKLKERLEHLKESFRNAGRRDRPTRE